ncbi:MAG: glycine--tRNA ligase subunit beta [Elusimicrobiaceae bacterium]|nr:glycine--tRNA ligase subunit beta [Elusimicrobiaceae bacterium]
MKDALLEIGTENMPARFIAPALQQLETLTVKLLDGERLVHKGVKTYATFRRLTVYITALEEKSEPMSETLFGPPARLLKDESGNYTRQADGFARKNGVAPDKLLTLEKGGSMHLAVRKMIKSEPAVKILSRVFPAVIKGLEFPKNMIWEDLRFPFARPIRSICALYGPKVVPFETAGVKSGRKTMALWALGGGALSITEPESYVAQLRGGLVLADWTERKMALLNALSRTSQMLESRVELDEALVSETVNMTENPVPVAGTLAKEFLRLPQELVTTVLKKQLKFFPVLNDSGELMPSFIAVRDGVSDNSAEVRTGYEAVMTARLSDAVFFFDNDRKKPLEAFRNKLSEVLFHERVGSMLKKSARTEKLALWIAGSAGSGVTLDQDSVRVAARYAYADLTCGVVGEFPELQGYMGGEYLHASGESGAAMSVREFYYPLTAKSSLPMTLEGAVVSLAGKIDTLAAAFASGMIPTGSEDPHALRRQAFGAARILLEKNVPVSVSQLLEKAFELVRADYNGPDQDFAAVRAQLEEFMRQRAETLFEEKGFRFDEIRAVFAAQYDEHGNAVRGMSFSEIYHRLVALANVRKDPDFEAIAVSFKRVGNILKKNGRGAGGGVDESLFSAEETAEKELYARLVTVKGAMRPFVSGAGAPTADGFEAVLREMVTLKPFVDKFFDDVMVIARDETVRNNRLALLNELYMLLSSVADLEKLQ